MDDYNPEFKNWRKTAADLPFVPDEFEFKPKSGSTRKQLTAVKKLMSDKAVTEIVNACDAAREGELIFQTIYRYSKSKSPVSRMWLQSMTTDAIQRAWDERKSASDYQNLADAAYSRSYADWLIGMNGSRIAEVFLPKKRTKKKKGSKLGSHTGERVWVSGRRTRRWLAWTIASVRSEWRLLGARGRVSGRNGRAGNVPPSLSPSRHAQTRAANMRVNREHACPQVSSSSRSLPAECMPETREANRRVQRC